MILELVQSPPACASLVGRALTWEDRANPLRVGHVCKQSRDGRISVVFDDWHVAEVWESHVDGFAWQWRDDMPPMPAEECAALLIGARMMTTEEARERAAQAERAEASRLESAQRLIALRPAWAAALVYAELHEDQSDSHTDYWGSSVTRRVALAWSRGARVSFREFRKAARLMPETGDLATAPALDVEHRENWSMGGGLYLGHARHSGWQIRKRVGEGRGEALNACLWSLGDIDVNLLERT